jgi:hypothetical protein
VISAVKYYPMLSKYKLESELSLKKVIRLWPKYVIWRDTTPCTPENIMVLTVLFFWVLHKSSVRTLAVFTDETFRICNHRIVREETIWHTWQ